MKEGLSYDDVYLIPKYSDINHRHECDTSSKFTTNYNINLPVISSPMDTITGIQMVKAMYNNGGAGILHRFDIKKNQVHKIMKINDKINPIAVAIGLLKDEDYHLSLLDSYRDIGVNVVCIDVANGYHKRVVETVNFIRKHYKDVFDIVVGNICTAESAEYLQEHSKIDAFRINIGNGSLCTTRRMCGVGVPSVTAILGIAKISNIPIIADGGIRHVGDICKALAAGADTVMIGSMLSGTKETPGNLSKSGEFPNETLHKRYRGAASYDSKIDNGYSNDYVEGVSTIVPYKGKVKRIMKGIKDGLRSSMSYLGARNLEEFRHNAEFIKVTNSGHHEAKPHLLYK